MVGRQINRVDLREFQARFKQWRSSTLLVTQYYPSAVRLGNQLKPDIVIRVIEILKN